jgi:hypothetical protein
MALKKIPCPQAAVNGWAGAVMSPEMYNLIDPNAFHLNIAPVTSTLVYPNKFKPDGDPVPYTCEEKSTIDAKFARVKNTLRHGKTYTEHAMTHSTSTSMMLSKLHRRLHCQQQVGTQR